MKITRVVGVVMVCLVFVVAPGECLAQFGFERIKDQFRFEPERPVTFYTNPDYDRVQGLFANIGVNLRPEKIPGMKLYADLGYGFKNTIGDAKWYAIDDDENLRWRYHLGVQQDFFTFKRLSFGAEWYDIVGTKDGWRVSKVENALAALFFREDFYDYYGTSGFRFYVDHRLLETHTLRAEVRRQSYEQVTRNTNWSIFGGDKRFAPNPRHSGFPILPGDETSLALMGAFDWRDNPIFPLTGWYVEAEYEHTWNQVPNRADLNTDGIFLSLTRYQQSFGSQRLTARFMFGTRSGSLGDQYLMDMGGVGSLRGYRDMEYIGNRFLMINANYLFSGAFLQRIPLDVLPFWEALSLGVFLDTGTAWLVDPGASALDFGGFGVDDLKTDVGVSMLLSEGLFRVDLARRLTDGNPKWRVTVRILESF